MNKTLKAPWQPNHQHRAADVTSPSAPANAFVLPRSSGVPREIGLNPLALAKRKRRVSII